MPRILTVLLVLAFSGARLCAQQAQLRLGDRSYAQLSFVEAVDHYELAFKQGATSIAHARRLADCYWDLRRAPSAEHWYAYVAGSPEAQPQDLYRYAEVLRANGKYAESDRWLARFAQAVPTDSRGQRQADAEHRLAQLMDAPAFTHRLVPLACNSERADLAPFISGAQLYFASARAPEITAQRHHTWDDQPFLDLYTATIGNQHQVSAVKAMGDGINTRYHESNVAISPDGEELYFTRNNYHDGDRSLGTDELNNVELFVRHRTATGWGPETPFPFNSAEHSTGHPAFSADGQWLYFTSDMPGGYGGKDLYRCERVGHGPWNAPVNLGPAINTEGDEMFPFVRDSVLYFASDGQLGLGGLDVFRACIRGTAFAGVENLGAPVNSAADDFGLCLDGTGTWGIVVSDRPGGQGGDDLYAFSVHSVAENERRWTGRVIDSRDSLPIPYLPVRLLDLQRKELAHTITTREGTYEFPAPDVPAIVVAEVPGGESGELPADEITISPVGDTELLDITLNSIMDLPVNALLTDATSGAPLAGVVVTVKDKRDGSQLFQGTTDAAGVVKGQIPDRRYGDDQDLQVTFEKAGYISKKMDVDFRVLTFLEQALTGPEGTSMSAVALGLDIGKAMNLQPIYFDYKSAAIRSDAAGELDLVAQVMRLYPTMKIDLRSHTDSRAGAAYNMELSQRRAAATRQYLLDQGIDAARVTAHGYGESRLVNKCTDGVDCSEAEHQMNRRTEFIVTGLDGLTMDGLKH